MIVKKLCRWNGYIDFVTIIIYRWGQFANGVTNFYDTCTGNINCIPCSWNFNIIQNISRFFF